MQFYSRKIVRLPDFDYSSVNFYFLTVCTHEKACLFGSTRNLSSLGEIAKQDMLQLPSFYQGVKVDHFVVMPNHIHAILVLEGEEKKHPAISQIVSAYKAGVSRKAHVQYPNFKIWQRSFYEHVIRNDREYQRIWNYIENNPQKWEEDRFYVSDMDIFHRETNTK